MTITQLPVFNPRAQRNGDTIRILTDLLQRAQQGEIQEIAIAWINDMERASNMISSSIDQPRLYGAIGLMLHRLGDMMTDEATDIPPPDIEDDPA